MRRLFFGFRAHGGGFMARGGGPRGAREAVPPGIERGARPPSGSEIYVEPKIDPDDEKEEVRCPGGQPGGGLAGVTE